MLLWEAVIDLVLKHVIGRTLFPDEFTGDEASGQANYVLRKLGFTVAKKGESTEDEEKEQGGQNWSEQEVRLIVADYLALLETEMLGKHYHKTDHRKALLTKLDQRSKGSIEFKHQNISAVMARWVCRTSKDTGHGELPGASSSGSGHVSRSASRVSRTTRHRTCAQSGETAGGCEPQFGGSV